MPAKFSPNRRRSIAVLNQGTAATSTRATHRRRAYSIVPGEKLSPAARARTLVPRKSILKGSVNVQNGNQSAATADTTDSTQSMDLTEMYHAATSRKSLNRRVSFASHAHVRLFEVQDANASNSSVDASPSPPKRQVRMEDSVEDSEDDNDENQNPSQPPPQRRGSQSRRRSSTAFSEFGEQSMDMDEGDSALGPQDFLNNGATAHAYSDDDEDFDEDEGHNGEDMDMTEAVPREFLRKRSLSLGGSISLVPARRRSSVVPLATSSSSHSENQISHISQVPQTQENLYPSLQLEDILNLPPDEHDPSQSQTVAQAQSHAQVQQIDSQEDTSMHLEGDEMTMTMTTTSSGDDTSQPMEFTIPVVRPPPPPSDVWLQLRAMTHAGQEEGPYVPPPQEPSDDPEANAIVDVETQHRRHSGEDSEPLERGDGSTQVGAQEQSMDMSTDMDMDTEQMDLTDALNRLQKARSSLGLPPLPHDATFNEDEDDIEDANGTFASTEDDSFREDTFSGDHTINVTKLRQSLGAAGRLSLFGNVAQNETRTTTGPPANGKESSAASTEDQDPSPVFSLPPLPNPAAQPPTSAGPSAESPEPSSLSPTPVLPRTSAPVPSKSPARSAPTVPRPFTFSLDARLGAHSPTRNHGQEAEKVVAPKSPSKLPVPSKSSSKPAPVFRVGALTLGFDPQSTPKPSPPRKRPAPPNDDIDEDAPSPSKRQAVGRLSTVAPGSNGISGPGGMARRHSLVTGGGTGVRRPSGYFAHRKSLLGVSGTSSLPNIAAASGSDERSEGRHESQRRVSLVPASARENADDVDNPLYPDVSRIEEDEGEDEVRKVQAEMYPNVEEIVREHSPTPSRTYLAKPPPSRPTANSVHEEISTGTNQDKENEVVQEVRQPTSFPAPTSMRVTSSSQSASLLSRTETSPSMNPLMPTPPVSSAQPAHPLQEASLPPILGPEEITQEDKMDGEDRDQGQDEGDGEMEFTEQWRGVVNEEDVYDGEEPTISIEQFFQMTGVRFMDELTAPRQSTIHPSQLRPQNRRRSLTSSHAEEAEPVPLAEFMTAMAIDVPQLQLYSVLATELSAWIEESKKICRQAEEDAIKVTPALFREFALADESEKADLVHQLKLIKAHNFGAAKSQWYDWKSQWVGQLQNSAAEAFKNLESDAKRLEDIIQQAQDMLPALRSEYAQAALELREEEADVAELQNSDKDYLDELKVSIAEQDLELQTFRASVSEAEAKLKRLNEKQAEIEEEKAENDTAIAKAEQIIHIQTESTSSEVFRLKDELEALQDLHMWRTTKLDPSLVEFVYASRFVVSVPCMKFRPMPAKLSVQRVKGMKLRERDTFPQLTQLMLEGARHVVDPTDGGLDVRKVVQRLGDFWTSCAQIRSQLTFLSIKYPLTCRLVPIDSSMPSFKATASVLFPTKKSKADISFVWDYKTYSQWPMSVGSLKSVVDIAYGSIERQQVLDALLARLSQATSLESHGCLLDACIEATEHFAQA